MSIYVKRQQPRLPYNEAEQYRKADIIIDNVCKVAGISWLELIGRNRNMKKNAVIGIIAFLCNEYQVHPSKIGHLLNRSRGNMINQAKRYRNYVRYVSKSESGMTIDRIYKGSLARLQKILQ